MRNISEIIGPFTWGLHSSPLARCLIYGLFGDHWAHLLCHFLIFFIYDFFSSPSGRGEAAATAAWCSLRGGGAPKRSPPWCRTLPQTRKPDTSENRSPTILSRTTFGYYQSVARGAMDHSVEYFPSQGIVCERSRTWLNYIYKIYFVQMDLLILDSKYFLLFHFYIANKATRQQHIRNLTSKLGMQFF